MGGFRGGEGRMACGGCLAASGRVHHIGGGAIGDAEMPGVVLPGTKEYVKSWA